MHANALVVTCRLAEKGHEGGLCWAKCSKSLCLLPLDGVGHYHLHRCSCGCWVWLVKPPSPQRPLAVCHSRQLQQQLQLPQAVKQRQHCDSP